MQRIERRIETRIAIRRISGSVMRKAASISASSRPVNWNACGVPRCGNAIRLKCDHSTMMHLLSRFISEEPDFRVIRRAGMTRAPRSCWQNSPERRFAAAVHTFCVTATAI